MKVCNSQGPPCRWALLAALAIGAAPGRAAALTTISFDAPKGAVAKVVQLLEELKARVEKDGETEQAVYDKFACWCEETTSKTASKITETKETIRTLGNKILELKGAIITKISEIAKDMESIRKNEEQQEMATSIRTKEAAAFLSEKTELEKALSALEKAIHILDAATSLSQGQSVRSALLEVQAAIPRFSPKAKQLATSLQQYTPQSGTIQGILQDMYRSFANTLQTSIKDESTAHRHYEDLMATWQSELIVLQERVQKNEKAKAELELMLADAETGYADLEAQLPKDVAFFDTTVKSCQDKTGEWAERKKLREAELAGIAEAHSILTSPEASEIFDKAIKPGYETFLQLRSEKVTPPLALPKKASMALAQAREALQVRARQSKSLRLATLAVSMHRESDFGHFDKVMESIGTLIETIKQEQVADDQKATDCKNEYQSIALAIQDLNWKIQNNEAELEKLNLLRTEKVAEEAKTIEALNDVAKTMVDMKSTREQENADFLQAKEEDQKAIGLLEQAVGAMQGYYANVTNSSLLARSSKVLQEPPDATFSDKGHRKTEAKSIVGLLETLVQDLKAEISNGKKAEESAQLTYEDQLKAALELEASLNATKINLQETIALTGEKITEEETALESNEAELATQSKTKQDITTSCDNIINGLEDRRKKRKIEIEGLTRANEYLAGARPTVLAQQGDVGSLRAHRAQ